MRAMLLRYLAFGAGLLAGTPAPATADNVQLGPLVAVSGRSLFADCTRDRPFEATDHWALICRTGRDCSRRTSWGEEQRLTDRSFDALLSPDAGGLFLGDYTGLAARGSRVWSAFAIEVAQDRTDIFVRRLTLEGRPEARAVAANQVRGSAVAATTSATLSSRRNSSKWTLAPSISKPWTAMRGRLL